MKNRVRGQVMHLNPPMMKKASEEIRNGKTEAPKNMRKKNDRFVFLLMWKRLPIRTPPMDHVLGLLSTRFNRWESVQLLDFHPWTSASRMAASSTLPFEVDLFGAIRMTLSRFTLGG